jgi:hypothetical protein
MNASKENARKAKKFLAELLDPNPAIAGDGPKEFLQQFLDAAERKLPTEAAFKADKKRSKAKTKVKASS